MDFTLVLRYFSAVASHLHFLSEKEGDSRLTDLGEEAQWQENAETAEARTTTF